MISYKYKIKRIQNVLILLISFLIAVIATSCMGFGPFSARESQTVDEGIETFVVTRGNILQEITTNGSVDTKNSYTYSFLVTGQVISTLEKGDSFKKGDVLIKLDNSEGLLNIKQKETDLKNAEYSLQLSKSSLKIAKINYQTALDENHFAIQLAEINIKKAEEATASALSALEIANISADLAYESASATLESTANIQSITVDSAEDALNEAERILEEAKNDPTTTPEELAKYEYNVETAEDKYELALLQQQSSVASSEISKESSGIQSRSSVASAESLYEQSLLSQSTTYWSNLSSLKSAQTQMIMAQENINQAGIQLNLAELSLETAQADLDSTKEDLKDYIVYAPYDGIVLSNDYKVGMGSSEGSGVSIISNEFLITTTINENDISRVKTGQEVTINLDAYSNINFSGTVKKIIPISSEENGIISFEILIGFEEVEGIEFFYGLSANLSIVVAKAENVLYVPIQAVYKENGKSYVDVLAIEQPSGQSTGQSFERPSGQQVEPPAVQSSGQEQAEQIAAALKDIANNINKVEVTTGINDYTNLEITSGLKEGDIIITSRISQ